MKTSKLLIAAAMSAAVAVTAGAAAAAEAEGKPELQKCYGVAKAGKNDCTGGGVASCAGHSKKDGEGFVLVPKGLCDKLVGGSTTEPAGSK